MLFVWQPDCCLWATTCLAGSQVSESSCAGHRCTVASGEHTTAGSAEIQQLSGLQPQTCWIVPEPEFSTDKHRMAREGGMEREKEGVREKEREILCLVCFLSVILKISNETR